MAFSVDISGEWSPRQAAAVMRIVGPEAMAIGKRLSRVDASHDGLQRVVFAVGKPPRVVNRVYPATPDDVAPWRAAPWWAGP